MSFALGIIILVIASTCFAGTPCPPREDLYPCSCAAVALTKTTFHTIVTCHRLPNTEALAAIFPALRQMQIDRFYLYDSFWEAQLLGAEHQQRLPSDWFTLLRIKEFEVVDTPLSAGFACDTRLNCRNSAMTSFSAKNSSKSEKVFGVCEFQGSKFSWVGCLEKLKHLHVINGEMEVIKREHFPVPMDELITVNLTNNRIRKIDNGVFNNMKSLTTVDVSHNAIEFLTNVFKGAVKLEFLDLSWNMITAISPDFFQSMPVLKTLSAKNNLIQLLKKSDWNHVPTSLRNIDLRNNPLHCDCDIVWINGTFHINVVLQGTCATPADYENSLLRRASRYLGERCDENGNIGTRPPKVKTTVNP